MCARLDYMTAMVATIEIDKLMSSKEPKLWIKSYSTAPIARCVQHNIDIAMLIIIRIFARLRKINT